MVIRSYLGGSSGNPSPRACSSV